MRICFSIQNELSEGLKLTDHFGESDRFVIFDTHLNAYRTHTSDPALCRGLCRCHLPALPQRVFDAVICRSIGARAFALLRRNQIDVFLTKESKVKKALDVWEAKNLRPAEQGVCRPEFVAIRNEQRRTRES